MNDIEFLTTFKPPLYFLNYPSELWPILYLLAVTKGEIIDAKPEEKR